MVCKLTMPYGEEFSRVNVYCWKNARAQRVFGCCMGKDSRILSKIKFRNADYHNGKFIVNGGMIRQQGIYARRLSGLRRFLIAFDSE